jgi:hypothetical protein
VVQKMTLPSSATIASPKTPTRSCCITGKAKHGITDSEASSSHLARSASSLGSLKINSTVIRRRVANTPSISITPPSFEPYGRNRSYTIARGLETTTSPRFTSDGSNNTVIHRPRTPRTPCIPAQDSAGTSNELTTIFNAYPVPASPGGPPTFAEAFFRLQWTHLSKLAWLHGWYPPGYFFASNSSTNGTSNNTSVPDASGLLDPSKAPLLASSVRDIFYVYGEQHAWELTPHVFRSPSSNEREAEAIKDRGTGGAKLGWSHARMAELRADERVWKGILKRGREVQMETPTVILDLGGGSRGGEGFARLCGVEPVEVSGPESPSEMMVEKDDEYDEDDLPATGGQEGEGSDENGSSSSEGEEDGIDWDKNSDEGEEVWKTPFERRIAVGMAF